MSPLVGGGDDKITYNLKASHLQFSQIKMEIT